MKPAALYVRVPRSEYEAWKRAAVAAKMPLAAYVRRAVRIQVEGKRR